MAAPKRKPASSKAPKPAGARILVVEARFYNDIADALLAGAAKVLDEAKAAWDIITVPGSLEIVPAIAIAVDAAAETLRLTTAGNWKQGAKVNLERALKVGDELGGHIVAGHVDGIAVLEARDNLPDMARLTLRVPRELMRFVATKGSVSLDGISLTVNEVTADTFSVLIIPHTLAVTTLGAAKPGDRMNLEIDLMARYAARLMETK